MGQSRTFFVHLIENLTVSTATNHSCSEEVQTYIYFLIRYVVVRLMRGKVRASHVNEHTQVSENAKSDSFSFPLVFFFEGGGGGGETDLCAFVLFRRF